MKQLGDRGAAEFRCALPQLPGQLPATGDSLANRRIAVGRGWIQMIKENATMMSGGLGCQGIGITLGSGFHTGKSQPVMLNTGFCCNIGAVGAGKAGVPQ